MKTKLWLILTLLIGAVGGFLMAQSYITGNAQKGNIDADEAKSIALKYYNGEVVEFEYDNDGIHPHYEFEIVGDNEKVELEVDAKTGEVFLKERKAITKKTQNNAINETVQPSTSETGQKQTVKENAQNKNSTQANVPSTTDIISEEKAISIALAKTSGGTVTDVDLDKENGKFVYEIEIHNGNMEYDIDIDAKTGKIIKFEQELED